ncbi:hypothetical protein N431DRAFT_488303 [Stipitochalara longipes BDJ]|nr:hypothetical protein N431DRAFT_488303 [Stipitochalara longipes BDJ]
MFIAKSGRRLWNWTGEQDAPPAPITERFNSPVQLKNIVLSCEHDVWGVEASPFTASLSDFESSSGNGCFGCKMFLKAIYEFNPCWVQEGRSSNPPSASVRLRFIQDSIYVVLLDGHDEVGSFRLSRNLKEGTSVIPTDITRNKIRYSISDLACNPLFQTTIDRAKEILSACNEEHEGCQRGNLAFTPRRLLHVDLANEFRQVFLFEPTKSVQYVALSYCWRPEAEVRDVLGTTSYNIESHRQKLPFPLVPQTIRDAMTDDEDDWSREAAKMLDVYANPYFSITVRESDCCKLGFLGQQSHKDPEPEGDNLEEQICSLDKRAWCFQESAVATRILYFTHNQVGWGCFQTSGGGNVLGETGVRLKTALGRGYSQDVNCGPFSQVREWIEVVGKYSNRQLSRETDKLPAISGLASLILEANQLGNLEPPNRQYTYFSIRDRIDRKQFRDLPETSPDVYLAGLWRKYFIVGLAWNVKKSIPRQYDNEHHNQTGDYVAPSWSWASVQGPVRYRCTEGVNLWKYSPRLRRHVEIGQVEVKFPLTQTSNLTGRVVSGFAILTGPLAEVQLTVLDSELSSLWKSSIGTRSPAGNR